jgi:1-deoxy-D-xylulose-5-phosphate synthase
VVFAVDRAGLVGSDGETHQGIFDYSFLTAVPSMSVFAPKNLWELMDGMEFALSYGAPIAVRYPRGEAYQGLKEFRSPIEFGKGEMLYKEKDIALLAVGSMVSTGEHVREKLKADGWNCTLANGRFIKPFDKELVDSLAKDHWLMVTMEENVLQGGYGLNITNYIHENYPHIKVVNIALPDSYVEHGNVSLLRKGLGIDSDSIIWRLKKEYLDLERQDTEWKHYKDETGKEKKE